MKNEKIYIFRDSKKGVTHWPDKLTHIIDVAQTIIKFSHGRCYRVELQYGKESTHIDPDIIVIYTHDYRFYLEAETKKIEVTTQAYRGTNQKYLTGLNEELMDWKLMIETGQ